MKICSMAKKKKNKKTWKHEKDAQESNIDLFRDHHYVFVLKEIESLYKRENIKSAYHIEYV